MDFLKHIVKMMTYISSMKIFSFVSASATGHTDDGRQIALNYQRLNPVNNRYRKPDGKTGIPAGKTVALKATFQIPRNNTKIVKITGGLINFNNPIESGQAKMYVLPHLNVQ